MHARLRQPQGQPAFLALRVALRPVGQELAGGDVLSQFAQGGGVGYAHAGRGLLALQVAARQRLGLVHAGIHPQVQGQPGGPFGIGRLPRAFLRGL